MPAQIMLNTQVMKIADLNLGRGNTGDIVGKGTVVAYVQTPLPQGGAIIQQLECQLGFARACCGLSDGA